jgi:hypothetical protein
MTDLTDFLNVVASAEDWTGVSAGGRGRASPLSVSPSTCGQSSSPDQGRLRQARAKAVERAARSAGARIPRHVRAVPVAALIAARPRLGEQGRERVY